MSVKTISSMVQWVEDNLANQPTLPKMAAYVGYSEFYCSAKFHEYVGISFKEYVQRRKLSMAMINLLKTDERIIDIALKHGFSSHEAFTRAFQKFNGYTPARYRTEKPGIPLYERAQIF